MNSVSTSYTYDDIDQLLTESQSGGYSYGYTYDHNGNRLTKTSGINVDTYTYDAADKLQTLTKPNGTATYHWDDAGRMTSVTGLYTRNFTWDYEDRMTSATVYGTTATNYTYNGVGTRTAKSGPFGSRTYKRDGVGVTAPVLSDGLASMVPGISEKTGSTTSYVHTDRLGSMKAMSTAGTVTDTATYDAFGNATHVGSSQTQKGFAANYGYQEDGESGLKLLGHRYYDPETGRFISRDPVFAGRNWFQYCNNNPLSGLDPTGLQAEKTTYLYKLVDLDTGEILKYGITWYPKTRYSGPKLRRMNARLEVDLKYDVRRDALRDERTLSEEMGGELNNESWAYKNRPMVAEDQAITEEEAEAMATSGTSSDLDAQYGLGLAGASYGASQMGGAAGGGALAGSSLLDWLSGTLDFVPIFVPTKWLRDRGLIDSPMAVCR